MSALTGKPPTTKNREITLISHLKYEHLLAGITAGVTSTVILHPLDIVKIRFAVNDGRTRATPKYSSIINAFSTIFKHEGIRGFYRGVTPNMWGAGSSWGLYFLFYNSIKHFLQNGNTNIALGPGTHLIAASEAGFFTLLMTNPLWVVKTRLCLQYCTGTTKVQMYNGMIDALVKIYKKEGVRGYYKGLVPGIFGVSHGAVQFMVYEEMKNYYNFYYNRPITTKLGTLEYLVFSASSKLIAVCATYPYQVVRVRLQNQHYCYSGARHCVKETWNYEGWRGFYKGMGTNMIRVTPAAVITFITYENMSHLLLKYNKNKAVDAI